MRPWRPARRGVDPRSRRAEPVAIETAHQRPWATVLRVPGRRAAWCGSRHVVPSRRSSRGSRAELWARWPDRVGQVLAHDADACVAVASPTRERRSASRGNPPEAWLVGASRATRSCSAARPHTRRITSHTGVPDLRATTLPARYEELLTRDLPLRADELARLSAFRASASRSCASNSQRVASPDTVQHDDLHMANVYEKEATPACRLGRLVDLPTRSHRSSRRSGSSKSATGSPQTTRGSTGSATAPLEPWLAAVSRRRLRHWRCARRLVRGLLRLGPPAGSSAPRRHRRDFDRTLPDRPAPRACHDLRALNRAVEAEFGGGGRRTFKSCMAATRAIDRSQRSTRSRRGRAPRAALAIVAFGEPLRAREPGQRQAHPGLRRLRVHGLPDRLRARPSPLPPTRSSCRRARAPWSGRASSRA